MHQDAGIPFSSPVAEDLWVEGNGPSQEIEPSYDSVKDIQGFIVHHLHMHVGLI